MPITYERDDSRRLITVTVTEPYAVEDILGVIDRQAAEGTWMYALLYELHAPMATARSPANSPIMSRPLGVDSSADRLASRSPSCQNNTAACCNIPR
jgi:hypothetical protein